MNKGKKAQRPSTPLEERLRYEAEHLEFTLINPKTGKKRKFKASRQK